MSWNMIKEDIIKVFEGSYDRCHFKKILTTAFICLIPKMERQLKTFFFFFNTSPVGIVHKSIFEVLKEIFKDALEKLISHSQNAFIEERQI